MKQSRGPIRQAFIALGSSPSSLMARREEQIHARLTQLGQEKVQTSQRHLCINRG